MLSGRELSKEDREEIWNIYYKQHAVCPQCGSEHFYTTLVGNYLPPDTNRCTCCDCGWIGERDQMVAKKEKQ